MNLAAYIDHTNLATDASAEDIAQLCAEARAHRFASVCVNPIWVEKAVQELKGSGVATCSVIGFPTGAVMPQIKLHEAELALEAGATELDMVINVAQLKADNFEAIREDVEPLAILAHENGATLKVILEVALLTDEEIVRGCRWCEQFGADYVKTSTGMLKGADTGATVHAVQLMRNSVSDTIGVKASGGVRDRQSAEAMIEAGATRIGTSSSVTIVADRST